MPDIALYYPRSHVRDESWLKAAALYLPKLALLAPRDYPFQLSRTARLLRAELGFLVDVDPARRAHAVATEFLKLINRNAAALTARYAWRDFPAELHEIVGARGDRCWEPGQAIVHGDDMVESVHVAKVLPDLVDGLIETRLAVPNANRSWIALHPRLGMVHLSTAPRAHLDISSGYAASSPQWESWTESARCSAVPTQQLEHRNSRSRFQ